jgi:hypothetical protein
MSPAEIEDLAFNNPDTIEAGLEQLNRMAERTDPDSRDMLPIIDATRTLLRLQGARENG